jgi:hypothetical protein
MKKRWMVLGLIVGALAFATTGLAWNGHGHGGKGKGHPHGHGKSHGKVFGPYDVVTTDNGSCGTPWANDTEKRVFVVKRKHDGSFRVTRFDFGKFETLAGGSPGACNTKGKHGSTVVAGVKGRFRGFLTGTVTGGTFDPNATCPADCGTTAVWIATFFGPSAQFSCFENSQDCRFAFKYQARRQGLLFHHWTDKGRGAGTFLKERFRGDIASA